MLNAEQLEWLEIAKQTFEAAQCTPLYLVGGFVRDELLNRPVSDVDLAVPANPDRVLAVTKHFAQAFNHLRNNWRATSLTLDEANGIERVVFQPRAISENSANSLFYFDFAAMHENVSIEKDLARRDFTINALAVPLQSYLANQGRVSENEVLDISDGLQDLRQSLIRAVSEANLVDDPLRLLRGVRQKAQLSTKTRRWEIEPHTLDLFRQHSGLITRPAAERTHDELNKILMSLDVERNLRLLDNVNILTRLIPELEEGRGCIQMPGHYYDVFDHTLVSVDRAEWLTTPPDQYFGLGQEIMREAARPENVIIEWPQVMAALEADHAAQMLTLRWATLLHDVGKPRTKTTDSTGHIHFYEHNRVGAEITQTVLRRLRYSNTIVQQAALMVQNHLRIGQLGETFDPQSQSGISDRATFRFLRDTDPVQAGMFVLSLSDHAAVDGPRMTNPRSLYGWWRHLVLTDFFARKCFGPEPERVVGKPKLLDGRTLMQELNLPPGPKVGYVLRQIEEAQGAGEISTRAEALELAKTLLHE